MQEFIEILLVSGKKGFEIAFFVIMPIMVFMMAVMRVLDKKGVLRLIAIYAAPVMLLFGIPGLGIFAILQILLVSFAAPVSTLRIMDQDVDISDRKIAAGLAAILAMPAANATFPMAAFGLNLPVTLLTSLLGGLLASFLTYKIFARHLPDSFEKSATIERKKEENKEKIIQIILTGAEEGFQLVLKAVPLFVLAVFLANLLKTAGAIALLEKIFAPVLSLAGISGAAVLSIATKYIAGSTAMMGVTIPLIQDKTMTVAELNKIVGFTINPLDAVGLTVLMSSGKRIAAFVMPAVKGAIIGVLFRGIVHLIVF